MLKKWIFFLMACAVTTSMKGQEPYYIQTFEDSIPSQEDVKQPLYFFIEGQGEWIFYNCFKGTNTKYIKDGLAGDLRMVKNGLNGSGDSYGITPSSIRASRQSRSTKDAQTNTLTWLSPKMEAKPGLTSISSTKTRRSTTQSRSTTYNRHPSAP